MTREGIGSRVGIALMVSALCPRSALASETEARVSLLRLERPGLDRVLLEVEAPPRSPRYHELGPVPGPLSALLRGDELRPVVSPALHVPPGVVLERRRLALGPARAAQLVRALEVPTELAPFDPLRETGAARTARLLDRALGGALSAQGQTRTRRGFRPMLVEDLRGRPALRLAAALLVAPRGPATAWEAAVLPSGLIELVEGASIDGRPLVAERRVTGTAARAEDPPSWVLAGFGLLLLLLVFFAPRLGALVWGLGAGATGALLLAAEIGAGWSGLVGWAGACFLPPTHLLLALGALSGRVWRRTASLRVAYASLVITASVASLGGCLLGLLPPISLGLAVGATLAHAAFASGCLREALGATGSHRRGPRRAVSVIEERSPYVLSGRGRGAFTSRSSR